MTKRATSRAIAVLAAVLAAWTIDAPAQAYPAKPLRMIVGFAPGGGTDVTARAIVQQLSDGLGQRVVIDNRPGANGVGVPRSRRAHPRTAIRS